MMPSEAKHILECHRPDSRDAESPEVAEALALARVDPELRAWFDEHQRVEQCLRRKLQSLSPPEQLRARILASRKPILLIPGYRHPARLAAAALFALLVIAAFWWLRPTPPDRFADYRQRMISSVLRSYHMELETNDPGQVRDFMARAGSPADFEIPAGLARLDLAGGGRLQWRGHPVSMICFERGDARMQFLFVLRRTALVDAPPRAPQVAQVNRLATMSWTGGDNVYLLAGPPEPGFAERFP